MSGIFDTTLTYQFIKKLNTPFKNMPAYKDGLIDDKGNFLKSRRSMTSQETKTLGLFDVMVINLKKLLAKVPGGSTRIGTIAATMLLLKSKPINEDFTYEDVEYFVEQDFIEIFNQLVEDGAVAVNSAGSMPTMTPGNGNPAVPTDPMMKYKKKNAKSISPILAYVKRNKAVAEDIVPGSQDTIGIDTKKKNRSPSKTEIVYVQNKVTGT